MDSFCFFSPVTQSPAAGSGSSHDSIVQNGPSSSTSDQYNAQIHYSSENDEDSGTDDEALQKEISRLSEKYVTFLNPICHNLYLACFIFMLNSKDILI